MALTASPDPVRPGEQVQYVLTMVNRYLVSKTVYLSAQVPEHTTVDASSITAGGGCGATTCTAGQTIDWGSFSVGSEQSMTVQFTARVDDVSPPPDGTVLHASALARVSSGTTAAATAADVVVSTVGLSLGMVASPSAIWPGGTLSYVLTYGNPGSSASPAAVLSVPLSAGMTLLSASGGGTQVGGAVQWNLGALSVGATGQRQFSVQLDAAQGTGTLLTAAELYDAASLQSLARASVAPTVLTAPGVQVALTASPDPVRPGEQVQYVLTMVNRYLVSKTVYLSAQVPEHTTVDASSITAGGGCGATTCTAGQTIDWGSFSVGSEQSMTVQFTARVDDVSPPPDGTVLHASALARVSSGTTAAATAADVVVSTVGLSLGMVASPSAIWPGGTLSYVLTYGNPGSSASPAAVLSVPLSAGMTLLSASGGGTQVGGAVQWNLGALSVGATGQRQFSVQLDAAQGTGTLLTAAELYDAASLQSLARASVAPTVLTAPGVQVALTASPDPVRPGEQVQYVLTMVNRYLVSKTVYLSAQVPEHTTVDASSITAGGGCGATTCTAGQTIDWGSFSVGSEQSMTVQFTARVDDVSPPPDGTVLHASALARVSSGTTAAATAADVVVSTVGLSLGMVASPSAIWPGGTLSYVLTYGNPGSSASPAAVLSVPLSAGMTLLSASGGGTQVGGAVQWNLGALSVGATGQRQFSVQLDAAQGTGTLLTAAELYDAASLQSLARASVAPTVLTAPGVQVALTASPDPVRPGEQVQYVLTMVNRYLVSKTVYLSAQVPEHTTVDASSITAGGGCGATTCTAGQTIDWGSFSVGSEQSMTVQFTARVDDVSPPPDGTVLHASALARVSSGTTAAATAADVVVSTVGLSLGMVASPSAIWPGGTLSYVLTYGNPGSSASPAAVLSVPLSAGMTLLSASGGGTQVGGAVQWNLGALSVGATGQRQFSVQLDAAQGTGTLLTAAELYDAASLQSLARASVAPTVLTAPGVQVALTASPDPVRPGEQVQYVLTMVNRYLVSKTVYLSAQVPEHTTVDASSITAGGGCGATTCTAGQTIDWGSFSVGSEQSMTVQFTARVDDVSPPPDGTVLHASALARVSSGTTAAATAADVVVSTVGVFTPTPIRVTNPAGLYVRQGPSTEYSIITEISYGQQYVAFEKTQQGGDLWYQIYLPCGNTGWCAGWVAGTYQGTTHSVEAASATQVEVTNTGGVGLNVRVSPGGSVRDSAYDGQRFVRINSAPSGNGCYSSWYGIYTPLSSYTSTGWVCGDFVGLSSSVPAGPVSLSGSISGPAGLSLPSVTVDLTGTATQSANPDGAGAYTFSNVADGAYTLTPNITGYEFQPTSRAVTVAGAAVGGLDFQACQTGVSLTGVLTDQNGITLTGADATITVNGSIAGTIDANGNYTVTGLACDSHTLTVAPAGTANFATISQSVDTFNAWTLYIQLTDESSTNGLEGDSGFGSDPVNTATGNYTYQRRDLEIAGIGMPFVFERSYNSRDDKPGPLGFNWTHNWNASLAASSGAVTIRWGTGATQTWVSDGGGGFIPQAGVFDALIDDGGGAYTVRKKDLTEYHFATTGRLASVEDKNGNTLSLAYTGSNLTQITDTAGRVLTLAYDASNRLTQITDPISRTVQFAYDVNGDLVTATDPNGNVTTYTYDANHQILTVVDSRGNTVVSNTYDALDRVVTFQTDAKGGATTFVYDPVDRRTTFTDALAQTWVHTHDSLLRLIKEEGPSGGFTLYEYDSAGNRIKVTDKNGNLTEYGYDAAGNVTTRTDALGFVTTLTYDTQNNPLTRTDALGNVMQFQYDANGNLTQTTDALGHIASITYAANGLPLTLTDPPGNVTTHAYDAEGNQTQVTDALGNITTHTYDGAGRRLNTIDPLGRVTADSYDNNDNRLTTTDPLGQLITHAYDGNDNRVSTTDRSGNVTSSSYDEKDLKITTTDALGNVETTAYDALDRRITVTDAHGNSTQYAYDAVGNPVQVSDALGDVTQSTYDPNGNRLSSTDARGQTTTFQYDALNRRTRATDPLGHSTTIAYDPLGRVDTLTSAAGQVTTRSYDALGRLTQVTNALSGLTQHSYGANGNRISTTDPRGNATAFAYDANNRRTTVTDALGNTATTVYDAAGQVVAVTDARGHTTSSSYDLAGRLTQVTDALGNITQHSYDANGNRLSTTDPLGRTIITTYDVLNRVVSVQDAVGDISTNAYDAVGNRLTETDRNGNTTQYSYDALNRLIQVTNALGHATQYAYDESGNRLSATAPLGHTTASTYDALNRRSTATDPLGNITTTRYDQVGRVLSVTDANGQVASFSYDPLDRLIQVTDAEGGVVTYTYDENGNRLSMTDPNGNSTSYSYDVLNRRTTTTEALGHTATLQYDAMGNVTQRTDAKGQVTQYSHDALNRLATVTYPGPETVAFTYDAVSNRTRMTDSLGTTDTTYDARNRITAMTDPFGKTVQYGYDANGNRTSLTYPGNKSVAYGYDALNRLTTVTDWLTQTTTYQYDAANLLKQTTNPNGTQSNYGYDNADRLTSLSNQKSDATPISSYAYTLDGIGNQLQEDRVEPINPALIAGAQLNTYDTENRLIDTNSTPNTFDANGNLTAKGADSYSYDAENRLIQTTISGITNQYQYDGLGNRYAAMRDVNQTKYVLDTNTSLTNVLAETNSAGMVQAYNIYGLGLIARILPDNSTHYYHYDSRGSTVALTDGSETVTDSYSYDPFGNVITSAGSNTSPFRYLGRYGVQDEGGELNYIRARYYDTEQKRFVSKDSKPGQDRLSQTLNRYAYATNSPLRLIDISGYSAMEGVTKKQPAGIFDLLKSGISEIPPFMKDPIGNIEVLRTDLESYIPECSIGKLAVPRYGNYGGPCWTGGEFDGKEFSVGAIDDLDALFLLHDQAYKNANRDIEAELIADINLVSGMGDIAKKVYLQKLGFDSEVDLKGEDAVAYLHLAVYAFEEEILRKSYIVNVNKLDDLYIQGIFGFVDISTSAVEKAGGAYVNTIEGYVDIVNRLFPLGE